MSNPVLNDLLSPACHAALIRAAPAGALTLASVLAAGLVSVQPAGLVELMRDRVAGYSGLQGRLRHTITAEDLNAWPWGVALVLNDPPTALLSARNGSCKPLPSASVGEEIGISYEVWTSYEGVINAV